MTIRPSLSRIVFVPDRSPSANIGKQAYGGRRAAGLRASVLSGTMPGTPVSESPVWGQYMQSRAGGGIFLPQV